MVYCTRGPIRYLVLGMMVTQIAERTSSTLDGGTGCNSDRNLVLFPLTSHIHTGCGRCQDDTHIYIYTPLYLMPIWSSNNWYDYKRREKTYTHKHTWVLHPTFDKRTSSCCSLYVQAKSIVQRSWFSRINKYVTEVRYLCLYIYIYICIWSADTYENYPRTKVFAELT